MSSIIHVSRLTWWEYRNHGMTEHDDIIMSRVTRPPVLLHIGRIAELVYMPGQLTGYVQEVGQQRRDLQPGESTECLQYLRQWAEATRQAAERKVAP